MATVEVVSATSALPEMEKLSVQEEVTKTTQEQKTEEAVPDLPVPSENVTTTDEQEEPKEEINKENVVPLEEAQPAITEDVVFDEAPKEDQEEEQVEESKDVVDESNEKPADVVVVVQEEEKVENEVEVLKPEEEEVKPIHVTEQDDEIPSSVGSEEEGNEKVDQTETTQVEKTEE